MSVSFHELLLYALGMAGLWAVPGPAGHFCFTLALDADASDGGAS